MMSDAVTADGSGLHAITLAAGGLVVATLAIAALGMSGVMPVQFSANDAVVAGFTLPWYVPVLLMGIIATRDRLHTRHQRCRPTATQFRLPGGAGEVLFAVLAAWLMLGEADDGHPGVRRRRARRAGLARRGDPFEVSTASWPDAGAMGRLRPPPPAINGAVMSLCHNR